MRPTPIEALLESWMVESGDFPELEVGQVLEMSLGASVRTLEGDGEVPASATVDSGAPTRVIEGLVTWVRHDKQGLHLVVQHAGALLAAQAAVFQAHRDPTWRDRLRGHRGVPTFVPVQLPVPEIGQEVTLEGTVGVMADYELQEIWPGPTVSARYRVERIDAAVSTPRGVPEGMDEFEVIPESTSRMVVGLRATAPPAELAPFDMTHDGQFSGELVSAYLLHLTPVEPLP